MTKENEMPYEIYVQPMLFNDNDTVSGNYRAWVAYTPELPDYPIKEVKYIRADLVKGTQWEPIDTFDSRMFSVMSDGTLDTCGVVKYKGEVPCWAKYWKPIEPPEGE